MCLFDLVFFFFTINSKPDTVIANGEDVSSEEEKEDQNINVNMMHQVTDSLALSNCYNSLTNSELFNGQVNSPLNYSVNGSSSYHSNEDDDDNDDDGGGGGVMSVDQRVPGCRMSSQSLDGDSGEGCNFCRQLQMHNERKPL